MEAETAAGRKFMDNDYQYDAVNNILSLENKAEVPSSDLMGGSSSYTYEYDDLYRLKAATGQHTGSNATDQYTLELEYNTVGGITNKNQFHEKSGADGGSFKKQGKTSYELDYTYGTEQPNAPKKIGDNSYSYDANGNQTGWKSDVSGQQREILWDSLSRFIGKENRIRAIADNGSAYHYVYDASGERVLKGKTTGQAVFKNGEKKAGNGSLGNYTVYVNPYIVLQSGGYTKHYFIEGQRIVSKIGGGIDGRGQGPLKAGNDKINYAAKAEKLFDGIVRNEKFIDENGNLLTAGKSGKVPPGQIIGNNGNNGQSEPFRYFFHPDHLGSTSYITDATGEVYQHLEYFAFGETFVEERGNTDKLPYKFNGKELDEETGLYYYGARYYDAKSSVWLSVDPKMDKYPNLSSYNFSGNNPIIYVDPDGRDYGLYIDHKNKKIVIKATYYVQNGDKVSKNSASGAIASWNKQKGLVYKIGRGDEAIEYNVSFDLSIKEVENPTAEALNDKSIIVPDSEKQISDGSSNVYRIANDKDVKKGYDSTTKGATFGNNVVTVLEENAENTTGAHEVGHSLGLDHSNSGVMTEGLNSSSHSGSPNTWNVRDIIRNGLKEKNGATLHEVGTAPNKVNRGKVKRIE